MLVHTITTTSECKVQEYLMKHRKNEKKAFVLTSRIPNDDAHIRYDVFVFTKSDE
ncbi:MAG: hypothetical protein ACFFEV_02655 [Candidatus Thorarchaeota archaeon]